MKKWQLPDEDHIITDPDDKAGQDVEQRVRDMAGDN